MIDAKGSARTVLRIGALPFLLLLLLGPASAGAGAGAPADDPYLASLLDAARLGELARDPYWRTLVHYKRGLFGVRSLVDDPDFFLAPRGKHDPEAELEATLRAFFEPLREDERHPVCRFPARYDWLRERLDIDESRLPVPGCAAFDDLVRDIAPESATLIFPTSHMNSPASMYGHTLLTIRAAGGSDLLAYAINYSAVTDETFGPFYIVKGLLGLYEGYFSILPYYAKLQEYSDVNDRDIWEYPLDLDRREVLRLLMHIYELQDIYSDYYFFNENCSYDLLFLLDAARPGLALTDQCAWWVIPLDTIREIEKSGLIRDAVYRPSRSTKVAHLASLLPESGRKEAREIGRGARDPAEVAASDLPAAEKITILDLAGEYLQYEYAKREIAKEAYLGRFLGTLRARSTLGEAPPGLDSIPVPGRPDEGHRSNRIAFGYGVDAGRSFPEIRVRPAYHELIDNGSGYKRGSQIVFLDFAFRYHGRREKVELESLDMIDIVSIAPRNDFFRHTSWKVRTGLFRRTMENRRRYLVYDLNPGFGWAYEGGVPGLWYLFVETDFQMGAVLRDSYAAGGGASTGILGDLTDRWKVHVFARDIYLGLGDRDNQFTAGLGQNFRLSPNTSLAAEATWNENDAESRWESTARLDFFF